MTKEELIEIRRHLIGALKAIENNIKNERGEMGYNNGKKITKEEKMQEKWENQDRPRMIWNSGIQGTYIKKKHGEIGLKRKNLT